MATIKKLEKIVTGFENDAYSATHKLNISNVQRDEIDKTYDEVSSVLYHERDTSRHNGKKYQTVKMLIDRMSDAMADIANGTVVYQL